MFCKKDKALVLLTLMEHVRLNGRNIGRMEDRRMLAPVSRVDLDYTMKVEQIVRYRKRTERESIEHLSTYLDFDEEVQTKRIRDARLTRIERIMAEGWCAAITRVHPGWAPATASKKFYQVQVSGDLDKMDRDLSKLILCGDLVVE